MDPDIRRRTTYLSRGIDGRHSHTYSPYFQSAQKKYWNIHPSSGLHCVGPMFELTACEELKANDDEFDAAYPESALSFGPSMCSFGLKYNDHNYAIPSGLTPPSMPPHLMDIPSRNTPNKMHNDSTLSPHNLATTQSNDYCSTLPTCIGADTRSSTYYTNPFSSEAATASSFITRDEKVCVFDERSRDPSIIPRHNVLSSGFDDMEFRYEPELKVIEVPEELAVSPSQLSDLDTDLSDDGLSNQKVLPPPPTDGSLILDGEQLNGAVWPQIRCLCRRAFVRTKLIRCPQCSYYQHVQCMEEHYSVSVPNLCEGYSCQICMSEINGDSQALPVSNPPLPLTAASHTTIDSPSGMDSMVRLDGQSLITTDFAKRRMNSGGNAPSTTDYVQLAEDRARKLGLLSTSQLSTSKLTGKTSDRVPSKDGDGRPEVDWERLNEMSRLSRRQPGDTNVNLRMPSPPRTSKRKQDLTTTSYNEADTTRAQGSSDHHPSLPSCAPIFSDDASSASTTPASTPTSTPHKFRTPGTPSTLNQTLTPNSEYSSSSGQDSPLHPHRRCEKRRHKFGRVLFSDHSTPTKRLTPRAGLLGADWMKDYEEAERNTYSAALLSYLTHRLLTNVERSERIPPLCLTRSPLSRVVLFDHNDKGLEASTRLNRNDVVMEVRANLMLLSEFEHFIDPLSQYTPYVTFYRGFGEYPVVADARSFGNSARFIRRSCSPNCHLDHIVVQDKLHIVIRSTIEMPPGTELTIPFDFDYRCCHYSLECACARSRCPVMKWGRKLLRKKVVPNLDYRDIESQLRVLSKPLSQESPNSKNSSFEHSGMTGSPLMRTGLNSSLCAPQSSPIAVHRERRFIQSTFNTPEKLNVASSPSQLAVVLKKTDNRDRSRLTDLAPSVESMKKQVMGSTSPTKSPSIAEGKLTFAPIITTRRRAAVAAASECTD